MIAGISAPYEYGIQEKESPHIFTIGCLGAEEGRRVLTQALGKFVVGFVRMYAERRRAIAERIAGEGEQINSQYFVCALREDVIEMGPMRSLAA